MTITYRFKTPEYSGNILYVNLIERYTCINDCLFCSKPTKPETSNIYEKKAGTNLYLDKTPTIDEIMGAIDKDIQENDEELAIIGLGEPLIYLPTVIEIVKQVKEKYNIKTRVDTNGLVKTLYENPASKLAEAGLDEIKISLNATNEQDYNALCNPKVDNAFENLVSFIKDCLNEEIDTYVSFVIGFNNNKTEQEYKDFALSLGIKKENIILRNYVEPT